MPTYQQNKPERVQIYKYYFKNNPNGVEHIEVSVHAVGILKTVTYHDTQGPEHIEVIVAASGALTHIDDI